MIEAVNSVVSNAPLQRASSQQAVSSAVIAAELESASQAPVAPYVDQISLDTNYDTAVLNIRDNDTGDVLRQFPSESTLEARRRVESARQQAELEPQQPTATEAPEAPTSNIETTNVAIAQQAQAPQASSGAGAAQAAIAALSTGAQSSAPASAGNVSVTA